MYHRLSIFVVFVVLASAIRSPKKDESRGAMQRCITEISINSDLVKGSSAANQTIAERIKCFYACIMRERNLINEDGTFNLDLALSKIPAIVPDGERAVAAIIECSQKTGDTECETAYDIRTCMKKKKVGFVLLGHGHHNRHHDD